MVAMKKNMMNWAMAFVASAFAVSCVDSVLADPTFDKVGGKEFVAHSEATTRSALDGLNPIWVAGDAITVFGEDGSGVEFSYAGDNIFKGDISESPKYYAVYPASVSNLLAGGVLTASVPSEQKLAGGQNVAPGSLVSFAVTENDNLYFRNAVGLVKINIGRSDIASVTISSSVEGEYLAGSFTVDPTAQVPSVKMIDGTGKASVTLLPEGETFTSGEYYVTTLPVTLSGLKVTFTNSNSESISVVKALSTQIGRNTGVNLGQFFTYEIGTPAELLAWNKANAKWTSWDVVRLTDDIDMSSIDDQWVMATFTGVFDGNGKTLSNAVLGSSSTANAGLFGLMNGTVKNLIVDGFNVTGSGTTAIISGNKMFGNVEGCTVRNSTVTSGGDYGGIIVARSGGANKHITDCVVQACSLKVTKSNAGAICGRVENNNLTVSGCTVSDTFIMGDQVVGGLIGLCAGESTIVDGCASVNNEILTANGSKSTAGGIVASLTAGTIINSVSEDNTVKAAKSIVGGIAGSVTGGHVINNISRGCLVSTENSGVTDQFVGLVVGGEGSNATGVCKNNVIVSGNVKYGSKATKYVGIISGIRTKIAYDLNYYNASIITEGDLTNTSNDIGPLGKAGLAADNLTLGGSKPIGEGYEPALADLYTTLNKNVETLSSDYPAIRKWQAVAGDWPTFVTE